MNANIIKKANDIVNSSTAAYVAVILKEGFPHCATRSSQKPDGIFSCYFSTSTSGDMAQSIINNSKTSVCFNKGADNVSLSGNCEIVSDMSIKKELWNDGLIEYFPKGVKDPEYCVIKFTAKSASLWIDGEVAKFDISDISKPQSKCGILCKVLNNPACGDCKGCMEMDGKPFWGECPVAVCCIDKGYLHCGNCSDMPCDILHEFSCGDSEHCDKPKGARLEMLKYWSIND
ncbi:MAG: pyridoxamine 5'-phosphate oxidase family protein [Clostridiales bacterium]|nr:pyridoxamine 5'-phosphate oxidase family protein [Clostridiales bacterium]